MSKTIMVLAEHRDGKLKGITKEALGLARELAPGMGADIVAVCLGESVANFAGELAGLGATRSYHIDDAALTQYTPEAFVAAIAQLLEKETASLVLVGHSYQAIDFFPRLAARLDAALVPDVTAVEMRDGIPVCTRKVINGKLESKVVPTNDGPILLSLQQGAFAPATSEAGGEVLSFSADLTSVSRRKVIKIEAADAGEVDLSSADIIVAGGRGVGEKEKFKVIFDLAEALGAAVGASRPPCDSEWVEHQRQIGSSGQVVSPKLYIALGISGAIQHLVGMRGSQCVVAINKDANAAIFQEASYGIVGDLFEIVPELIKAVNEAREA